MYALLVEEFSSLIVKEQIGGVAAFIDRLDGMSCSAPVLAILRSIFRCWIGSLMASLRSTARSDPAFPDV